jgi:hypothetical protein
VPGPLAFARDVASLYHRNAWLFLKLLLPAALFGYLVVFLSAQKADEILRYIPRGAIVNHMSEVLESDAFRIGGLLLNWLLYCFAFSGIAAAVLKLVDGERAVAEECFGSVREQLGSFFRLSLILALLLAITFMAATIGGAFLYARFMAHTKPVLMVVGWATVFLVCLVVSRFGLALPALVLEHRNVSRSLARSVELTKGCWTILAVLLLESVGGSYLIYQLVVRFVNTPLVHRFAPEELRCAAVVLSLLLGALLQPHILIGFSLLYICRSSRSRDVPLAIPATTEHAL